MRTGAGEPELPLQQAGAAAGIDDPAAGDDTTSTRSRKRNLVRVGAKRDPIHPAAVEHFDAGGALLRQQMVFEAAAIELKRWHRRKGRRTELETNREVPVVPSGEEISETELFELAAAQVRFK